MEQPHFVLVVAEAQNTLVEQQGVVVMAEAVLAVLWVLLVALEQQILVAVVAAESLPLARARAVLGL
jgi:hypothetical protein